MMVEIVVHLWYLMKCALWAMIADATLLERCIEALKQVGLVPLFPQHLLGRKIKYRKVASSRPVYYSILKPFGQRSHYISIKFPLHKQSENFMVS